MKKLNYSFFFKKYCTIQSQNNQMANDIPASFSRTFTFHTSDPISNHDVSIYLDKMKKEIKTLHIEEITITQDELDMVSDDQNFDSNILEYDTEPIRFKLEIGPNAKEWFLQKMKQI
eukprot:TRINITY_DN14355_c0_g1_i1.p1 TRINITY_DN14355_c0_g1~~TRINITY_DN14355_c0_g1_i1.p1  ORF type:complete len:128 (-),score=20.04 TRINITY_DN14355_c0_g1_i1:31-381(-)